MTDLRYALRSLRRTPLVSGTAVFSLALGIAALTTMGSAVDALLLRPFQYDLEGRLVYLGTAVDGRGTASTPTSAPDFLDLRSGSRTMDVAALEAELPNVIHDADHLGPPRAPAATVRAMVLKGATLVAGVGTVLGLGFAFLAARGMRAFLFGVNGVDFPAFASVVGTLAAVTLVAAWVPAGRAASVDPVVALRSVRSRTHSR